MAKLAAALPIRFQCQSGSTANPIPYSIMLFLRPCTFLEEILFPISKTCVILIKVCQPKCVIFIKVCPEVRFVGIFLTRSVETIRGVAGVVRKYGRLLAREINISNSQVSLLWVVTVINWRAITWYQVPELLPFSIVLPTRRNKKTVKPSLTANSSIKHTFSHQLEKGRTVARSQYFTRWTRTNR